MKNWKRAGILMSISVAVLALLIAGKAWADAAPPPEATASNIMPGQGTQVQMISETVVLDVRPETLTSSDYVFTRTVAFVTADFLMHNHGNTTETMDVRFPMGWPTRYGWGIADPFIIQNVNVSVDGKQVITRQASFDGQPWTVWPDDLNRNTIGIDQPAL